MGSTGSIGFIGLMGFTWSMGLTGFGDKGLGVGLRFRD